MGVEKDLRAIALFDGLDDAQLGELVAAGAEVAFGAGDELFVEGRPAEAWWVLLEGRVSLVRRVGHSETELAVMETPGQWAAGTRSIRPAPAPRPRCGSGRMPGSRSACT